MLLTHSLCKCIPIKAHISLGTYSLICYTCKHWRMNLDLQQLTKQESYSSFNVLIDLIHAIIYDYVIHFRMAKALECPLAAVCTGVCEKR